VLVHPWDAGTSERQWVEFVRTQGFGQLVASGRDREVPIISPTQYALVSPSEVVLHLARPNPIWDAIDENPAVVLSVAGDWAYVPGAWRAAADVDPSMGIPTTYYAAVQLICTAAYTDEPGGKASILRAQLGVTEPDSGIVDPATHDRMLAGIRGLRLTVREVRSKFKYDGHKDAAHRARVAGRLGPSSPATKHIRLD
jgi:transcriptional regulator